MQYRTSLDRQKLTIEVCYRSCGHIRDFLEPVATQKPWFPMVQSWHGIKRMSRHRLATIERTHRSLEISL